MVFCVENKFPDRVHAITYTQDVVVLKFADVVLLYLYTVYIL